jgi:hypothetical protein
MKQRQHKHPKSPPKSRVVVVLDPDVAREFPNATEANSALRTLMEIFKDMRKNAKAFERSSKRMSHAN